MTDEIAARRTKHAVDMLEAIGAARLQNLRSACIDKAQQVVDSIAPEGPREDTFQRVQTANILLDMSERIWQSIAGAYDA